MTLAATFLGADARDWLALALALVWLVFGLWWARRDAAENPDMPHWDAAGYPPEAQEKAPRPARRGDSPGTPEG